MFLPSDAWIPEHWNRNSRNKKYKKVSRVETVSASGLFFEWPETPEGLDLNGGVCGINNRSPSCQFNITTVDGFLIELEKDVELKEETIGIGSIRDADELFECQICHKVLGEEQAAVIHIQLHHGMNVSGDVDHDSSVLLRTGYVALKKREALVESIDTKSSSREDVNRQSKLDHSSNILL